MKRFPRNISFALLFLLAAACKDTGSTEPSTSKIDISLGKYYSAQGTVRNPSWSAGDLALAVNIGNGRSASAKAIGINGNTATFLFSLPDTKPGDPLLCASPAEELKAGPSGISLELPAVQDGSGIVPVQMGTVKAPSSSYAGAKLSLKAVPCLFMATVQKGAYSVSSLKMKAIGGEKLAGTLTFDYSDLAAGTMKARASESEIEVRLAEPLDCRLSVQTIPVFIAPVTLSSGYEITFFCQDGSSFSFRKEESCDFPSGGLVQSEAASSSSRKLIACGSDKVYVIDATIAHEEGNYYNALLWSWSSTDFGFGTASDHIDDCKPVNDGKQFLVTCSNKNAWCAVVDYPSGKVSYVVEGVANAHSAELLPGGRLVVASSDGGDKLVLFDTNGSTSPIASYPLTSAHGVVWVDSVQRLYAIGGSSIQVYSLSAWDSSSPALKLEKTISSSSFVNGLHDASLVDANTIIVAGNNAALLDVRSGSLSGIRHLNGVIGIKSVNYNADSGELYYTYAAAGTSEGSYDWSSHKIRYTDEVNLQLSGDGLGEGSNWSYITVSDIDMYKVRVLNW